MEEKIYYVEQSDWQKQDYYYLHRYMHKMIYYYKKRMDEIRQLDLSKMSTETKTILYCIIKYYNYDFLMDGNLQELRSTKPLDYTLVIDGATANEENIYSQMNIVY